MIAPKSPKCQFIAKIQYPTKKTVDPSHFGLSILHPPSFHEETTHTTLQSSPLKIGAWETTSPFLLGLPIFRGELLIFGDSVHQCYAVEVPRPPRYVEDLPCLPWVLPKSQSFSNIKVKSIGARIHWKQTNKQTNGLFESVISFWLCFLLSNMFPQAFCFVSPIHLFLSTKDVLMFFSTNLQDEVFFNIKN